MKNKILNLNHKGVVIWFTGLSGAGKSTLAENLQSKLTTEGYSTKLLDGDALRSGINSGLGFTESDRTENIRRAAEVAKLFIEHNTITLCTFITPTEKMRSLAKAIIGESDYMEVFVKCSIELCEKRDVKGLYKKARAGNISNFTGISSLFETPLQPDILIDTENFDLENCLDQIYFYFQSKMK